MAERLGVSVKTFSKDVKRKRIPHLMVGRSMRFDPVRVEAALLTIAADAKPILRGIVRRPAKSDKYAKALGL